MIISFIKSIFRRRSLSQFGKEIDPDEVFLDSSNLPNFDTNQFEGRLITPIGRGSIIFLGVFFALIGFLFVGKLGLLQIRDGEAFELRAEKNRLRYTSLFSKRGVIYDRNAKELAYNDLNPDGDFSLRKYTILSGLSHILGYVKYPSKDNAGFYWQTEFDGKDGLEKYYNKKLTGENGVKIIETNALSAVQSESVVNPPKDGDNLTLSIDSEVQNKLHEIIQKTASDFGFAGGAGVIMDVKTGELLTLASYPEYNSNVMTDGSDGSRIGGYSKNKSNPYLNRAVAGLYTPGSIIKPFVALGVLNEGIIDPNKKILSTGSISIPNPYYPDKPTIFKDWKAHGWVDMREALSVSSDVYFYEVGGGYQGQKGLGIDNIDKYVKMFGFGEKTGIDLPSEAEGTIPTPEWKKKNFDGEEWRVGNTYHTAIGQYGFQVTPLQAVRATAAIANDGVLLTPSFLLGGKQNNKVQIDINKKYFQIVKEGMRMSATTGTGKGLNMTNLEIAVKTGTAELGASKEQVNSWVVGFFPYDNPKYAFAAIMERGSVHNTIGALYVMRQLFDWMTVYKSEYLKNS